MARNLTCFPYNHLNRNLELPILATRELCLATIYHETGGEPLWVSHDGPKKDAAIILHYLKNVSIHGLNSDDYGVPRMLEIWSSHDSSELAELDTLITYNLVKYIHDISYGQLKPRKSNPALFAEAGRKDFNPVQAIEAVLSSNDLIEFFSSLPPQHHHYTLLTESLDKYRKMKAHGGWITVPDGKMIRPFKSDSRIAIIKQRLAQSGDLPKEQVDTEFFYDEKLQEVIRDFQSRHGLKPDSIIGPNTITALNISVEEKLDSIKLNLARWRWQSHDLGGKYILVNIAGYNLKAYRSQGTEVALDFAVIVGQEQHQTPVFSDRIKYVEINPFWTVTPSIAKDEDLPELQKDPNHLVDRNIRLFSSWQADAVELDSTQIDWAEVTPNQMAAYRLRQDPGPWNALGKIKFVFPNRYSVYMHDTPAHNLFRHSQRSFSHGCIRVSKPYDLARYVLEDQTKPLSEKTLQKLYKGDERTIIRLSEPIPVHITYQTSWVDKDGTINFNRDVYLRDQELRKALFN